ncbi:hypothetical protein H0W26_01215 [Candidatus Dependentiae bacterium]|nr:hypothetical protein [Candidatus Dependentiae bacterium]
MLFYFFIIGIPLLTILDYLLGVVSLKLYSHTYGKHITIQSFEENSLVRKEAPHTPWFKNKQSVFRVLIATYFIVLIFIAKKTNSGEFDDFFNCIFGSVLMSLCLATTNHLVNILTFQYANKNEDQLRGQAYLRSPLDLYISLYRNLSLILPLGLIAFASPNGFTIGCAVAPLYSTFRYLRMIRKAKTL